MRSVLISVSRSGLVWIWLCRKGLEMRKGLLTTMGLTGLLAASLVQGAVAAPIVPPATATALHGPSLEQVYYYHGRHYPYRYNNRYMRIDFIVTVIGIIIEIGRDKLPPVQP